jgi:hypothetical protein
MPGDRSVNVAGREIPPDQVEPRPGARRPVNDAEKKLRALKADPDLGSLDASEQTASSEKPGSTTQDE